MDNVYLKSVLRFLLSKLQIHSMILYIKDLCFNYIADLDGKYYKYLKYAKTTVSFRLHYEILYNSFKTLLIFAY